MQSSRYQKTPLRWTPVASIIPNSAPMSRCQAAWLADGAASSVWGSVGCQPAKTHGVQSFEPPPLFRNPPLTCIQTAELKKRKREKHRLQGSLFSIRSTYCVCNTETLPAYPYSFPSRYCSRVKPLGSFQRKWQVSQCASRYIAWTVDGQPNSHAGESGSIADTDTVGDCRPTW